MFDWVAPLGILCTNAVLNVDVISKISTIIDLSEVIYRTEPDFELWSANYHRKKNITQNGYQWDCH